MAHAARAHPWLSAAPWRATWPHDLLVRSRRALLALLASLCCSLAGAAAVIDAEAPWAIGITEWPAGPQTPAVTLWYPTRASPQSTRLGAVDVLAARDAPPETGNRRLVVLSHGSRGTAWPQHDLAATLVAAGYVVAAPEHAGDNVRDPSRFGPPAWETRPAEISATIDRLAAHPQWAARLWLDRVGVHGMSAGGLTALVLAGAQWSPARLVQHCLTYGLADVVFCAGSLAGEAGVGTEGATVPPWWTLAERYGDSRARGHHDARVAAVVAAVPVAAVIHADSLQAARTPIGLIEAGRDAVLPTELHLRALMRACAHCELLASLPEAGHTSILSPWGPQTAQGLGAWALDPPSFQRDMLPQVYEVITRFFDRQL